MVLCYYANWETEYKNSNLRIIYSLCPENCNDDAETSAFNVNIALN